MTLAYRTKYVLLGLLIMAVMFVPALQYLRASVFTGQTNAQRMAVPLVKVSYPAEITVQDDSGSDEKAYDADWQREQSRLLRSFTWLEDELKITQKTQELEIYQNYLGKLDRCENGDWDCLEDVRWQMDDFAFAMEKYLR